MNNILLLLTAVFATMTEKEPLKFVCKMCGKDIELLQLKSYKGHAFHLKCLRKLRRIARKKVFL